MKQFFKRKSSATSVHKKTNDFDKKKIFKCNNSQKHWSLSWQLWPWGGVHRGPESHKHKKIKVTQKSVTLQKVISWSERDILYLNKNKTQGIRYFLILCRNTFHEQIFSLQSQRWADDPSLYQRCKLYGAIWWLETRSAARTMKCETDEWSFTLKKIFQTMT